METLVRVRLRYRRCAHACYLYISGLDAGDAKALIRCDQGSLQLSTPGLVGSAYLPSGTSYGTLFVEY